jgi:hypothetical protein
MQKLRLVLVVATLTLFCSIWLLMLSGNRHAKFHARSYLALEVRETHFFPTLYRDEAGAISNFLSGAEVQLLMRSCSEGVSFALEGVGSPRNTMLFHIDYSGPDSNVVQVVASNAANFAISFYATNQPSWEVTLVETGCLTPVSRFERLEDFVRSFWRRCEASLGL